MGHTVSQPFHALFQNCIHNAPLILTHTTMMGKAAQCIPLFGKVKRKRLDSTECNHFTDAPPSGLFNQNSVHSLPTKRFFFVRYTPEAS